MKRYSLQLVAPSTGPHVYEYVESISMIPLTQLTLASLTPGHYDIRILDGSLGEIVPGPCDLAAITVISLTSRMAYELAAWYRNRGIPVVMGGPHATLYPDEVREHCDALVIGEADELWGELLGDFERGALKREYREREKPELTKLPLIRHDWVDKSRYGMQNLVQTSRGCSFGCDFCAITPLSGRKSRHKSVPQVVAEIEESLRTARGLERRRLFFVDDNIVNDTRYARELFKAITPLKLWWGSQCSLSIAYDDELLDLAWRSGCRGLFIGFETPSQALLDGVHKNYDASRYGEYIRKIKDRGIFVLGSFLFGLDGDTRESFKKTVDFCMEHGVDFVNFHIVSPTPGTPFFGRLKSEGRLLHENWEYFQENVTFTPTGMSIRELQEGQIWAYEEYFRPANILRRSGRYWASPLTMLFIVAENLRFARKMRSGTRHQREFLKFYNREILKI